MVYFVGAGPGDVELITVKGQRLVASAQVIIYAGSLVNPCLLKSAKADCEIWDSSAMTLKEVLQVMQNNRQKLVVRLHTGDPAVYGAIQEQMDALDQLQIPYEVVPGVSSFSGGAASLKRELTLPGVSQTVILTRVKGRTGVPEAEEIEKLAVHKATMAIFLSVNKIEAIMSKIMPFYGSSAPVAVVYKATWPEEKIVRGTVSDIAEKVKAAGIEKTALIFVGGFLSSDYELSQLYDENFSHGYRKKKDGGTQ